MVLGYQCEVPAFANTGEEPRSSVIAIEKFVKSLHPHGVSVSDVRSRFLNRISNDNEICIELGMPEFKNDLVCKLLEMLDDKNEKPYWGTIAVTLSLIGDPSVIPRMISFIEGREEEIGSDSFSPRAWSSAIWALGILINEDRKPTPPSPPPVPIPGPPVRPSPPIPPLAPPTESGSPIEQASKFLIEKGKERGERSSKEGKKVTNNRQSIVALQPPNHETSPYRKKDDKDMDDIVGDPYILSLAFADTDETKNALLDIRDRAVVGGRNREWLDEVIRVQEEIHNAGDLLCYREPGNPGC
jgi:hypothetical protein